MQSPMMVSRLLLGLATLALATLAGPRAALAAGVVTTCDEAHLDAALGCGAPSGSPPVSTCSGGGLVTFNCGGPATITVTSTKIISKDTTIDGGGLVTIDGGGSVQVFRVSSSLAFAVQNLTIAHGNNPGGGGIDNTSGTVTVTNCTFSGNKAPSGFGGGIDNAVGTVTVTNSTFSGNSAGAGGGIFNIYGGTVTVTNSTFSGNSAAGGGGIDNDESTVTVTNCTLSGNSADSGDGGGIYNHGTEVGGLVYGTLTVTNTIVANTTSGGDCVNDGTVTDGGHNFIEDAAYACGLVNGVNGDIIGVDPKLDAGLANNGGPTQTIAVLSGSQAINAGDEAVCAAPPVNSRDQRGYVRPGGGNANCTIGAFEFAALPPARPVGAPALSPVGLFGLAALLSATGWVLVWHKTHPRARRASPRFPRPAP